MPLSIFKLQGEVSVNTGNAEAALKRVDAAGRQTTATLTKAGADAKKAAGGFSALSDKFKELSAIGSRLTIGITAPLTALGVLATQTAVKFDSLKRGLIAVAGSSAEAEKQLARLKEVAKVPGLGFEEAIQGSINLQAAGLSADEAERSLRGFGNALAIVGKGKADLQGVTTALTQIQSKGKISAEEINQLAERVPQIRQILLGAFGTADTEILQQAGITSKEFVKVVNDELAKLPQATGGAQNALENFDDVRKRVFAQFGDALLRIVVPAVEKLTPVLESLGNSFAAMSPAIQTSLALFAGAVALAGPLLVALSSVGSAVSTLAGLFGAGGGLAAAIGGLATPIGWAVAILAALAAAAYGLYKAWQTNFGGIRDTTNRVIASVKGAIEPALASIKAWWAEHGAAVMETVSKMWEVVKQVFEGGFKFILNLVAGTIQAIVGDWDGAMKSFGIASEGGISGVKAAFAGLSDLQPQMGEIGQNLADALMGKFKEKFAGDLELVKELWGKAKDFFGFGSASASKTLAPAAPRSQSQTVKDLMAIPRIDLGLGGASATGATASGNVVNRASVGFKKWAKQIEAAGGEAFIKAVEEMSGRLGIDPNKLMNVMAFESGFRASAKNPGSSGSGLIQFMGGKKGSAAALGTTVEELRGMSAIEQLKYVEAYFKQFKKMADTQEAVYTAVLAGKPVTDPNKVLFKDIGRKTKDDPYYANRALDKDKSGTITAAEAAAQAYKQGFLSGGQAVATANTNTQALNKTLTDTKGITTQVKAGFEPISVSAHKLDAEVKPIPSSVQKAATATQQLGQATTLTAQQAEKLAETMARVGRQDILDRIKKLNQELSGIGKNMDLKVQAAQLEAIYELRKADEDATLSMIRNRIKLADATTYHAEQSKAAVLDFLATETRSMTEIAADARIGIIRTTFDGIKSGFDKLTEKLGPFKGVISQILTDLTKLAVSKIFQRIFGLGGGAAPGVVGGGGATSGGGSTLGNVAQSAIGAISGNNGATAGGSGGGGVGASGKASGGGGIGGAIDTAQSVGGMLKPGGALSKLPGLSKVGGFLKGLPGIGGALGKLGSLFGFGGGGAGAAAGAAGAAGGAGGAMGGLLAAAGGPVGIGIMLATTIGIPLIKKLFGGDPLKPYKRLIKAEYGIDASKQILQKVFEIGQSKFGKDAPKRQIETVRLPEVRDMLSEYAGAFQKGGNSKLFDSRIYSDAFSSVNQIKVGMINGGRVPGPTRGFDHVPVMMDGGELVISNDQQRRAQRGRGGMFGKGIEEILARLAASMDRFEAMPADHVVMTGLARRPGLAAADVRQDFERRGEHSKRIREIAASY